MPGTMSNSRQSWSWFRLGDAMMLRVVLHGSPWFNTSAKLPLGASWIGNRSGSEAGPDDFWGFGSAKTGLYDLSQPSKALAA